MPHPLPVHSWRPTPSWCLEPCPSPATLTLPRHRKAHRPKGFPQVLNVEIGLKTWGSITLLYRQLFQQVLLPLSFGLQVTVVGDEGGWGGEAGSHDEAGQAAHCQGSWREGGRTISIPSLLSKTLEAELGREQ